MAGKLNILHLKYAFKAKDVTSSYLLTSRQIKHPKHRIYVDSLKKFPSWALVKPAEFLLSVP